MDIINNEENGVMSVSLIGRLDSVTAPKLEQLFNDFNEQYKEIVFDFSELEYVSSAGLRVILLMQKKMNEIGKMTIKNVKESIMEIFEITGFADILNIE